MTVDRLSPRAPTPESRSAPESSRADAPLGLRPNVEAWEVGGRRLSTAEVLDRYQPPAGGEPARFLWRDTAAVDRAGLARAAREGGMLGAAAGAALGAVFGLGVDVVGHLGALVTLGAFGPFSGIGLIGPTAIGAGLGAVLAGVGEPLDLAERSRRDLVVEGRLAREVQPDGAARTVFRTANGDGVDLVEHARARPGTPALDDPRAWWVKQTVRPEDP